MDPPDVTNFQIQQTREFLEVASLFIHDVGKISWCNVFEMSNNISWNEETLQLVLV